MVTDKRKQPEQMSSVSTVFQHYSPPPIHTPKKSFGFFFFNSGNVLQIIPPLSPPLGLPTRDKKADNSFPVVGQSFKALCNLPTSFFSLLELTVKIRCWLNFEEFTPKAFSEAKVRLLSAYMAFLTVPLWEASNVGCLVFFPSLKMTGCLVSCSQNS